MSGPIIIRIHAARQQRAGSKHKYLTHRVIKSVASEPQQAVQLLLFYTYLCVI